MSKQEDGKMHHGTTESDPATFKLAEKFNLSSEIGSDCLVSVSFFMLRLRNKNKMERKAWDKSYDE